MKQRSTVSKRRGPLSRIVICEDNPQLCRLLVRGLDLEGVKITVTTTVQGCLGTLTGAAPDLVLTDLLLKGENTLALIRQLRAEYSGLKIVAMTGAGHEWLGLALAQGADCALEKPFLLDTLAELIQELITGKNGVCHGAPP